MSVGRVGEYALRTVVGSSLLVRKLILGKKGTLRLTCSVAGEKSVSVSFSVRGRFGSGSFRELSEMFNRCLGRRFTRVNLMTCSMGFVGGPGANSVPR